MTDYTSVASATGGLAGPNAVLGSFGDIVFTVSADLVRTWEENNFNRESVWKDHEVIGRKPASEFTGSKLTTLDLKICFNAELGIDPLDEMNTLTDMLETGDPNDLVLCGQALGLYTVRTLGEAWKFVGPTGPMVIEVDVSLSEYIDTLPSQADQKSREDELMRTDTGKGGPQKLPGVSDKGAVGNAPKLKPAVTIDPVTRMVVGGGGDLYSSPAAADGEGMDYDL